MEYIGIQKKNGGVGEALQQAPPARPFYLGRSRRALK